MNETWAQRVAGPPVIQLKVGAVEGRGVDGQINEWGALLLLSTVTSLVGKDGKAAKRTGPRSSS